MEGSELSSAKDVWKSLAASESRIELMTELIEMKVGFAETEEFNLDLSSKFRSKKFNDIVKSGDQVDVKVVLAAMETKLSDEKQYSRELHCERDEWRRRDKAV